MDKNQSKLNKKSDKSFSFLSADEIEKLKQENEKKIATITRETKKKFASSTTASSDNVNNNDQFDINENEEEFYHNKNLIISQHELDEDADER
jgi:protein scribble